MLRSVFILLFTFLIFLDSSFAGLPPTTVKGQSETSPVTTFNIQAPYNQATTTGSGTRLIENGNGNLLINPSFEHSTYSTSWGALGDTTPAVETTEVRHGKKAAKLTLNAQSGNFWFQSVTPTIKMQGMDLEYGLTVKTSLTGIQVCALHAGSTVGNCTTVLSDNVWRYYPVNYPGPSSGSVGVTLYHASGATGDVYVDDAYVGQARNIGPVTNPNIFTAKVSSAGVVSDETGSPVDWINGNCVVADTSQFTCTFTTSLFTATPTCFVSFATDTSGVSQSATSGTVTSSSAIFRTLAGGGKSAQPFNITCTKTGADFIQPTITIPQQGWYVDATMDGANPSLGVAAVTSYTEIIDAGLTLKPQTGTQPVGVMCSSTNAATAPSSSNTTCAAGSESLGINFSIPKAGAYQVCAYYSHSAQVDNSESIASYFQLIETPTNAQTLTLEGGTRLPSTVTQTTLASAVDLVVTHPMGNCSVFNWTSSGIKGVRLMYTQVVQGTPDASIVLMDGAGSSTGSRNLRWIVIPLTGQVSPVIAGNVTTTSTGLERVERFSVSITGASTCTLTSSSVPGTTTSASSTVCAIAIPAGVFSAVPTCVPSRDSITAAIIPTVSNDSATQVRTAIWNTSGTIQTGGVALVCMGPR